MPNFPTATVEAPAPLGLAVGSLLATFPARNPSDRWEGGGVQFEPECGGTVSLWHEDMADRTKPVSEPPEQCETFNRVTLIGDYSPTGQRVGTPEGLDIARRRALRKLERNRSTQLEAELWTGAFSAAHGLDNDHLAQASATVINGTATALKPAFSRLIAELRQCMGDERGVIHMHPHLAAVAAENGIIKTVDGRFETVFGDYVVAGAGYPGTAPNGADNYPTSSYVYATGPVEVRLGEVTYLDTLTEAVNRRSNDVSIIVEQNALVMFDSCCHLAINVTTPTS